MNNELPIEAVLKYIKEERDKYKDKLERLIPYTKSLEERLKAAQERLSVLEPLVDVEKDHEKALRSIKPHWKPSEEQIEALDTVYKTHGADSKCRRVILGLINDLKKL